jgi:hypothetical protein
MTLDSLKSEKKKGFAISTTEIAKNRWDGSSSTTVDAQLHRLWQLFICARLKHAHHACLETNRIELATVVNLEAKQIDLLRS